MRILVAHNFYQQPGGEDRVFANESALLESKGHHIFRYVQDNEQLKVIGRAEAVVAAVWNKRVYRELTELIERERIELCHFHNTFPLTSPAAFYAARAKFVPVVATLHNHRLVCPGATLYRNNAPCEACVGKRFAWPAVVHRCYRNSLSASAVTASTTALHGIAGTWSNAVQTYIALTSFSREVFVRGGIPADRIRVKPHFVPNDGAPGNGGGGFALYLGRLAPGKGIETLLGAWKKVQSRMRLVIAGDGPLAPAVQAAAARNKRIYSVGHVSAVRAGELLRSAALLVFPSEAIESFGLTIIEAFAAGTPVLAAAVGGVPSLVHEGRAGRLYRAGDASDLAAKAMDLIDSGALPAMRTAARGEFESRFTSDRNYAELMAIYDSAFQTLRSSRQPATAGGTERTYAAQP